MTKAVLPVLRPKVLWTGLVFFLIALFPQTPPAHAQQAFIAFVCYEQAHAEALAGEITDHNVQQRDPRWLTCNPVMMPIADMSDAPAPLMVLADWKDNPFALYAVNDVFLIVYWINGYRPDGTGL